MNKLSQFFRGTKIPFHIIAIIIWILLLYRHIEKFRTGNGNKIATIAVSVLLAISIMNLVVAIRKRNKERGA